MTSHDYLVGIRWHDVIVIGAGTNGLVAALLLEARGLKVLVVDESDAIGGGARTEHPFACAPELAVSTGAVLEGVIPLALLEGLGMDASGLGREPGVFVPTTTSGRFLAMGSTDDASRQSYVRFFSESDWSARSAMRAELDAMREDLTRAWLAEPLSVEETAEQVLRAPLRAPFVHLCRGSIGAYLGRFGFASERAQALEALEALGGLCGTWDTPGSGTTLLSRLGATASAPVLARRLNDEAAKRGIQLLTETRVASIVVDAGVAKGVVLKDGAVHYATAIVSSVDPFRTRELAGRASFTDEYNAKLDACARDGTTLMAYVALDSLPRFSCAPDLLDAAHAAPTIRLFPEGNALESMRAGFDAVTHGALPSDPAIAWRIGAGAGEHHAATLSIQAPYELTGTSWEVESPRVLARLLATCDRYAPGTSARVVESSVLDPKKIEERFGVTRGHVQHVDDAIAFADRPPHSTAIQGLYACSAGTPPTSGVLGAAGYGVALRVARDMSVKHPA